MKIKMFLVLLVLAAFSGTACADTGILLPKGKVNFSLWIPKESAEDFQPGQHVSVEVSKMGTVVLDGLIMEVGKKVSKEGSVTLVLAVSPAEARHLKDAQYDKADFSLETLPAQ